MEKDIKNADTVTCKLKLASTKLTNLKRKKAGKKQKLLDRQ